jgi:hypothetical protein
LLNIVSNFHKKPCDGGLYHVLAVTSLPVGNSLIEQIVTLETLTVIMLIALYKQQGSVWSRHFINVPLLTGIDG